jgi:hypothetical protein
MAFGEGVVAANYVSVAIGRYNNIEPRDGTGIPSCGEAKVFQIGWGDDNDNRKDILSITNYGRLQVRGTVNGSAFTCASDIRLKEDIVPLKDALEKINNVQPISYYFKNKKSHPSTHEIGFSAQEIEKEYPELVEKNDQTGYLSVNYPQMTAVAIQAIKEQQIIIKTQDEKISSLENRIQQLEKIVLAGNNK